MKVTLNGQDIHYDIQGEGAPVLMLHGWGCNIDTFAPVSRELAKTRKVIALDFPGFGDSPEPREPWGVGEYTDLTEAFIRHLGIEGADVINHSFGGRVSILLASRFPELVGRIVFTDAAGVLPKRGLRYKLRVGWYKVKKKVALSRLGRAVCRLFGVDVEARMKSAGSEDYRALQTDVMRQTFVRVVNEDLTPYLKDIKASSLLIFGSEDTATPVAMGQVMEREIVDSALIVLDGAGHYSYLDQFGRYMAIVKSFLEIEEVKA